MNPAWVWFWVAFGATAAFVVARKAGLPWSLAVLSGVMAAVFVLALEIALVAL